MPRDENVIDYIFRSRGEKKVADGAKAIVDAFGSLKAAGIDGAEGIDEVEDAVDDLGRAQDDLKSKGSIKDRLQVGGLGEIASGFALGTLAVHAFEEALQSLQSTFEFTVGKAAAQEEAVVRLDNAMRSAGTFSRAASADFQSFASSLQEVTAAGDEEIITLGALIAQIGKLRGQELERATKAALDMQAALGKTSQEVGIFLGKLAQGETGSLTEIGIVIDQTIPRSEKFLAGLEAIEAAFGGTAEATVRNYTGATQQLSNAWGDFGEAIGEKVLPALTEFARFGTGVFTFLSGAVRDMGDQVQLTVPEMAEVFTTQVAAMRGSVGEMRRDLEEGLRVLADSAERELRLTIKTADLDSLVETLGDLDDVIEDSTARGNRAFQDMVERMRAAAEQEIAIRVRLEATQAGADLANLTSAFTPEVGIDVLLQGSDAFRDALNLAQGLREEVERPLALGGGGRVEGPDLVGLTEQIDTVREEIAQLENDLEIFRNADTQIELRVQLDDARARLKDLEADYDAARETLSQAIQTGNVEITFGESSLAETAEEAVAELQPLLEREQLNVVAAARLKINRAETIEELEATLRDLESRFIEAVGRAQSQPTERNEAVREALRLANEEAKALAVFRAEILRTREELDATEPAVARVAALFAKLGELNLATTFEQIKTQEMVRGITDATEAVTEFERQIDKLLEGRDVDKLRTAFQQLDAAIKASDDGVEALDDDMRVAFEAALAQVRALLAELEPLERKRIIEIEIAKAKAKKKAQEAGKEAESEFEKAFGDFGTDVLESAFGGTLDLLTGQLDDAASAMEERFKDMVDAFIGELLRLAAVRAFKFLLDAATGGATSVLSPFGSDFLGGFASSFKAGVDGGGLPPGVPGDLDGSSVRQFTGAVVRPLDDALRQLTLQSALLVSQQPLTVPRAAPAVVPFIEDDARRISNFYEIRAIDTADVERWLRDGPGRRAFNALTAQGRF